MIKIGLSLFLACAVSVAIAQETIALKDFGKSNLVVVYKKNANTAFPVWFEETDSLLTNERKKDSVYTEYYRIYENRMFRSLHQKRVTTFKKGNISVKINDSLYHSIFRDKIEFEGFISGKKGTVIKTLLPSGIEGIPDSEQYALKNDSASFIIYKPELGLIELEATPEYQKRRMLGKLYQSIISSSSGTKEHRFLNRNLDLEDEIHILFSTREFDNKKLEFHYSPAQIMQVKIIQRKSLVDKTELYFESFITDLKTGTKSNFLNSTIEISAEGFAIDAHVYIRDSLYEKTLQVYPPGSAIRMHPFFPIIDLTGPLVEAIWDHEEDIQGIPIIATSYWNSSNNSRLSFLSEFPIPWRDNGDSYIGKPIYLKIGSKELGQPTEVKTNSELHFSMIKQSRDSVSIEIYSPEKQNVTIDYLSLHNEQVTPVKQSYGLSAGLNEFKVSKLDARLKGYGIIILSRLEGGEKVEVQRFSYTETQN